MKIRPEHMEGLQTQMQADTPRRIREDLLARSIAVEQDAATGDLRVADGRGFVTRLHFDTRGLPKRVILPSRREYGFEQDAQGRLAALDYPGGQRVEMARDANGFLSRLSRPGLLQYQFRYDAQERLTTVVDPYARMTTLDYSDEGDLASLTDRAGGKVVWERDAAGKLLAVRDALGKRVVYETDDVGRLSAVHFPDGSREEYGFYAEENIVEIVQRSGDAVLTYFSESGLPEEIAWADGGWLLPVFGAASRVVGLQNEDADLQFAYDDAGNVLAETGETGTVGYAYDPDGRLTALETPWGERIGYTYDEDGRVTGVVDWEGRVVALGYAPDGTLETIHLPNGLTETRRYAQVGRLEQSEIANAAGRIVSRQVYNYDLCERLTGIADQSGAGTDPRDSCRLEYDAEGRLLKETSGTTGIPLTAYGYDVKGNLSAYNRLPVAVGRMDEPQSFAGTPIRYDANGNMSELPDGAGGTLRCRFGANGTLREVHSQTETWRYEYDGLSRRTAKTNGVTTWRYGWAQQQLLWEEVQETPDAAPVHRDYLWLPDSMTPLAFRENGQTYWLQSDAREAVTRAFDEAGNVAWSARYDSFGQAHEQISTVRQAWRLSGQYADDETGLHYNLARYYSPHLKAYLSRDPQWHQFGASNYSYCLNDPWNRADPFGTISHMVAVAGNIAVSTAVTAAVTPVAVAAGSTIGGYVGGAIGAALGGPVGAFVGVLAGRVVGGFLGRLAAVGVGAFAGALAQQKMETGKVCIPCALKEAAIAAALTGALMGVGRIPVVRNTLGKVGNALTGLAQRLRSLAGKSGAKVAQLARQAMQIGRHESGSSGGMTAISEANQLKIKQAVENKYNEVMATQSNKQRGPVLTGILDTRTEKVFFGQNTGIPQNLHPILDKRLKDYLQETGGITPEKAGEPGAHSEINALNDALWARTSTGEEVQESDLKDFLVHNLSLKGTRKGTPVPRCANCFGITQGVSVTDVVHEGEVNVGHVPP